MNITETLSGFFSYKKIKMVLVLVLVSGILLIVFSKSFNKGTNQTAPPQTNRTTEQKEDKYDLEKNLEDILSKVQGVGETKVLILYETSEEKFALKDSDSKGGEQTVLTGEKTKSEPFVYKSNYPKIGGVLVVANGLDTPEIKNVIIDAVSSVLSIPVHKVKVLKST